MVVDLKLLKEILNEQVVDVMDHRHLNHEVPPFDKVTPTVENVAEGDLAAGSSPTCNSRMHGCTTSGFMRLPICTSTIRRQSR